MNRYYYYLVAVNMLVNIIVFIPKILLNERKSGAVMAIVLAIFIALFLLYCYTNLMNQFPGKGLPELLKENTAKWFYTVTIFLHGIMWFIAGLITLIGFTDLIKRFMNPDMPQTMIVIVFLAFITYAALLDSKKVLYSIEIILLLSMPLIVVIFIKAYTSESLNWDFVRLPLTYYYKLPDYTTISACAYTFQGFLNISIFNRVFTKKQVLKGNMLIGIGLFGLVTLFTTMFIPIGFQGFQGVGDLVFPWIVTSDSMRMQFIFVERVLYIFLLLFVGLSIINIVIHWHVAVEYFKCIFTFKKLEWKGRNLSDYVIFLAFWVLTLTIANYLTEYQALKYTMIWLNFLIPFNLFGIAILWYFMRRAKA
ncbi:GerAB/ArcD/ProY family transporter [Bacillus songklensis]|uniref:GerAB/ArcD/ProY family transporter n=1 Tax=Bacillus songklensis TaxID=1069116 RepID=A0ABV8AZZ2_9BACI